MAYSYRFEAVLRGGHSKKQNQWHTQKPGLHFSHFYQQYLVLFTTVPRTQHPGINRCYTYLVLNERRHGQVVEQLGEAVPHRRVPVLAQTLVVEAVHLRDLAGLVVAPQDRDAVLEPDLNQGDTQTNNKHKHKNNTKHTHKTMEEQRLL